MKGIMLLEKIQQIKARIRRLAQSQKGCSSKAIKAFGERLDRLNQRHDRLPVQERLATSQIMYNELEEVLMRFELLDSPQSRPDRSIQRKSCARWN
jgi:hypothetical protein